MAFFSSLSHIMLISAVSKMNTGFDLALSPKSCNLICNIYLVTPILKDNRKRKHAVKVTATILSQNWLFCVLHYRGPYPIQLQAHIFSLPPASDTPGCPKPSPTHSHRIRTQASTSTWIHVAFARKVFPYSPCWSSLNGASKVTTTCLDSQKPLSQCFYKTTALLWQKSCIDKSLEKL